MGLSRVIAFGMTAPLGYGQMIARNYEIGLRAFFVEFILTIALVPLLIKNGDLTAALVVAGLIPWASVGILYMHSHKISKVWSRGHIY